MSSYIIVRFPTFITEAILKIEIVSNFTNKARWITAQRKVNSTKDRKHFTCLSTAASFLESLAQAVFLLGVTCLTKSVCLHPSFQVLTKCYSIMFSA